MPQSLPAGTTIRPARLLSVDQKKPSFFWQTQHRGMGCADVETSGSSFNAFWCLDPPGFQPGLRVIRLLKMGIR